MGGGGAGQGEGQSGCDGRFGHFFPRQRVFRFFAGSFQMPEDEPGGMDGEGVANGLVMDVPVGFDGVAEHVHAGAGGHVFWDSVGQFGIDDGGGGVEGRGVERGLEPFLMVGEDGNAGDFAAGAGGGRDGDERQAGFRQGPFLFQILACRGGGSAESRGGLGAVQYAAASDSQDKIAAVLPDQSGAGVALADVGVGRNAAVHGLEGFFVISDEPGGQSVFFKGWRGDKEAAGSPEPADFVFQTGDHAVAEMDGDGLQVVPVHGVPLLSLSVERFFTRARSQAGAGCAVSVFRFSWALFLFYTGVCGEGSGSVPVWRSGVFCGRGRRRFCRMRLFYGPDGFFR